MIIEQIIEFELMGIRPRGRTCTHTTGYFYDKTKNSKKYLRVDYCFLLKYSRGPCTLLSPIWAKPLTKFNSKMQDFKRVLT